MLRGILTPSWKQAIIVTEGNDNTITAVPLSASDNDNRSHSYPDGSLMLTYDLIRNFTDIILPAMFKPNHFTSSSSFITLLVVVMGGSKSKPVVESARKVLEKRVLNDTPLNSSIKNVSLKYTPDNNNSHVAPSSSSSSSKQSVLDEIEINNAMFKDMSKFPTIKTSTAYENQVNNTSYIHMQFMVITRLYDYSIYVWTT